MSSLPYESRGNGDIDSPDGLKPIDPNKGYQFLFIDKTSGMQNIIMGYECKGSQLPKKLREFREEFPSHSVTAYPVKSMDEEFIDKYGIGLH